MDPIRRSAPRSKLWLVLVAISSLNFLAFVRFAGPEVTSSLCRIIQGDIYVTAFGRLRPGMLVDKLEETVVLLDVKNREIDSKDLEIGKLRKQVTEEIEKLKDQIRSKVAQQPKKKNSTSVISNTTLALSCNCGGDRCGCSYLDDTALPNSEEIVKYINQTKLPLGLGSNWSAGFSSYDPITAPVGHGCLLLKDAVDQYMNYKVGEMCPDDLDLAQRLLMGGCEPLPRRRCFARSPENFSDPFPAPLANWNMPPDHNILWTPYTCKSFSCLNSKLKSSGIDCLGCFNLTFREIHRWNSSGRLDFSIQEVLKLKKGSIRIGLDLGGGTGSFAVRMKEHNVVILTSTLDLDGPFNNFVAHRGVVPLFMSITQRLPFFDNTLDLIHTMHVLKGWIPAQTFEFIMYDIYRVLRPGGLFWLDHFFCLKHRFNTTYLPIIDKMNFVRVKWAISDKLDRGPERQELYLSALLEKPKLSPVRSLIDL